jgi:hypothetical protein
MNQFLQNNLESCWKCHKQHNNFEKNGFWKYLEIRKINHIFI